MSLPSLPASPIQSELFSLSECLHNSNNNNNNDILTTY